MVISSKNTLFWSVGEELYVNNENFLPKLDDSDGRSCVNLVRLNWDISSSLAKTR